jgi:hypothetical protein
MASLGGVLGSGLVLAERLGAMTGMGSRRWVHPPKTFSLLFVKLFLRRFMVDGFCFGFAEVQMQPCLAQRHGSSGV